MELALIGTSLAWCEANAADYPIGLIPNATLEARAAPLLAEAQTQSDAHDGAKVRLAGETAYQAGSWPHPRRVVFKAEILVKGPNTRFVVTTRSDEPLTLYDWYVDRGESEKIAPDERGACVHNLPRGARTQGQPGPHSGDYCSHGNPGLPKCP